jgi:hypothetical protein
VQTHTNIAAALQDLILEQQGRSSNIAILVILVCVRTPILSKKQVFA